MLKLHEIEYWVLRVIDALLANQPSEDSRVELKSAWIDPKKAARQIAGHANAARGEPILWIIGVDENNRKVVGAASEELSDWYHQVKVQFDGLAPSLTHCNVPFDDKIVVGLLFETERAPFVVKNPLYGQTGQVVDLEVPWRENNRIRSAKRDELLRLLSPLQAIPKFDIRQMYFAARINQQRTSLFWDLRLLVYIETNYSGRIVIPFHKMDARIELPIEEIPLTFENARFVAYEPGKVSSLTVGVSTTEAVIEGPGSVWIMGHFNTPVIDKNLRVDGTIIITLRPVNAEQDIVLQIPVVAIPIERSNTDEVAQWKLFNNPLF